MPACELARKLVIAAPADHKFHFIVRLKDFQIFEIERFALAGIRALHIHDFHDATRNPLQWPLSAGLDQYLVAAFEHSLHQWNQLALLEHGLAASDLNQSRSWAQALNFFEDLLGRHFLTTVKTIFGIAPRAAQITARQPHEYAWHAGVCRFALQRLVNFSDLHKAALSF